MARVSKKIVKNASVDANIPTGEKIYKTAIYARLSAEDLGRKDSGAIENQVLLVQKYIERKPYLRLCETYIDNGKTGTNFDRKGFQNLIEAIKHGKINCIAVKDLSRFGRDYIETGNYLEKIFPFLGVRFISVNDGFDSHNPTKNGDNLTVILKNLVNDIYAKDISKKCRAVIETKQKKGYYTGNHAPYGYIKSSADRYKLVIDEETAPVVRNIFKWKLEGMADNIIARQLNNTEILSPTNYYYLKGILTHPKYAEKILWNKTCVRTMLLNTVYIGHMTQGKRKSVIDNNGLPAKYQPKETWITVENTHEPIIDPEIFYAVNDIIEKRVIEYNARQEKNINAIDIDECSKIQENIFAGHIKCANCGKSLIRKRSRSKNKTYVYFMCPTSVIHSSSGCVKIFTPEYVIRKAVLSSIKHQIALLADMGKLLENINSSLNRKNKQKKLNEEFQSTEQRLHRLHSLRISLYDDFKNGLFTELEYNYSRQKYEIDSNLLTSRLDEITAELKKYTDNLITENRLAAEMRRFVNIEKFPSAEVVLSGELLTVLIERIIVYSNDHIEIRFKYQDEFKQLQQYIREAEERV